MLVFISLRLMRRKTPMANERVCFNNSLMVHISTFKGVHCVLWYIHFEMEWHTTITNHSKTTDVLKLSHKAYVCAKQDDEAIAAQTHTHTHTQNVCTRQQTNIHSLALPIHMPIICMQKYSTPVNKST